MKKEFPYSQEFLQHRFHYDPETGILSHRNTSRPGFGGKELRNKHHTGYLRTYIEGKNHQIHRLVWVYFYGKLPEGEIDHINGVRSDNRIINLRDVSHRDNSCNMKKHRKGGLPGCYYHKAIKKFMSRVRLGSKMVFLGLFPTELEAHNKYMEYRKEHNL